MKYTTRTEVVKALVELGMSLPYAKVAVDQQYNYDEHGDKDDLLRGNHEDLSIPHVADDQELISVMHTWNEGALTTEGGVICVDGEPTADINGIPLYHPLMERIAMRVDQLVDNGVELPATWWDEAHTVARENGDLFEIAALAIAQIKLETGE